MKLFSFSICVLICSGGLANIRANALIPGNCTEINKGYVPKNIALIKSCVAAQESTKERYFNKTLNDYLHARKQFHERLIEKTISKAPCVDVPIALFTGGLPGAGKSTALRMHYKPAYQNNEFVMVNADDFQDEFPEFRGWNTDITHDEASDIAQQSLSRLAHDTGCKRNFVYDGTLRNLTRYEQLTKKSLQLGYKVFFFYVETPPEVAAERVIQRFRETGRYVSTKPAHGAAKVSFENLKTLFRQGLYTGLVIIDGVSGAVKCSSGEEFVKTNLSAPSCDEWLR